MRGWRGVGGLQRVREKKRKEEREKERKKERKKERARAHERDREREREREREEGGGERDVYTHTQKNTYTLGGEGQLTPDDT